MSIRSTIVASVLASLLLGAASAGAHGAATGLIVVRLVTDPSPPGAAWTYSGAGSAFQLGVGSTEHAVTGLADGEYRLAEKPAVAAPGTLTALGCTDPSGGSRTAVASATADIALASGETVTCTFTHRALGPR